MSQPERCRQVHRQLIFNLKARIKPIKSRKMAAQFLKTIINPLGARGFRYRGRVPPAGCPLGVEFRALSAMPTQQLILAANSVRLTLRLYESTRTMSTGTQTVDIQSESKNQTNQKPKNGSTVPQDNN